MIIDFENEVIKQEDSPIPMNRTKLSDNNRKQLNAIFQRDTQPKIVRQATTRVTKNFDDLFRDSTLGKFQTEPVHIWN